MTQLPKMGHRGTGSRRNAKLTLELGFVVAHLIPSQQSEALDFHTLYSNSMDTDLQWFQV
jgi:hypothetical protein